MVLTVFWVRSQILLKCQVSACAMGFDQAIQNYIYTCLVISAARKKPCLVARMLFVCLIDTHTRGSPHAILYRFSLKTMLRLLCHYVNIHKEKMISNPVLCSSAHFMLRYVSACLKGGYVVLYHELG